MRTPASEPWHFIVNTLPAWLLPPYDSTRPIPGRGTPRASTYIRIAQRVPDRVQ